MRDLSEVPDGWRVVRLGEVAEVNRGVSWSREQESSVLLDDAVPTVRIGNVQRDGFRMDHTLYIRGVSSAEKARRSITPLKVSSACCVPPQSSLLFVP